MKKIPEITIVVIVYNNEKFLPGFLNSLKKVPRDIYLEYIFVDNASTDSSKKFLEKLSNIDLNFKLISNKKNEGFARAVNKAIIISKGKFILLLNPDSTVPKKAISQIYKVISVDKRLAVVGGTLIDLVTMKHQPSHLMKPNFLMILFEFTNLKKVFPNNIFSKFLWYENVESKKKGKFYVDATCGAFMIIRKEVGSRINFFDENYFMYLEDLDFCLRIKKSGYKVAHTNKSHINHFSGGSSLLSNPKNRINEKAWRDSRKYFFQKHYNIFIGIIFFVLFNIEDILLSVRKMLVDKE